MPQILTFICLLFLLTGCVDTTSPLRTASLEQPVYVMGTHTTGSDMTEPRPRQSQFFKTENAGFVVIQKGAAYYLLARIIKSPPAVYYVRIKYENPLDKTRPFVNDMDLKPTMDEVRFSSSDVVWGIRNYDKYTIQVDVYTNRENLQPIDTLIQPVRAYVDTTRGEVRVEKGMSLK
jgi:hypothetical protein